jgi:60 kDa SS-A/Ro ribonucleoprotein
MSFGATDCAKPMTWAMAQKKAFDVFVVYTDCETYHGSVHPSEALRQYRRASGIADARLVVVGMSSSGFSIADPADPFMMDVVGFDAASPAVMADFAAGLI